MRVRGMVAVTALALCATACLEPTQATVAVSTDALCPIGGTTITFAERNVDSEDPAASTEACRDDGYIGTIVATPRDEKDAAWALRVVTSIDPTTPAESCVPPAYGPSCIVARRSLSFVPNKSLRLPVAMRVSCAGVVCPEDETCVEGFCQPAAVDPDDCAKSSGCTPTPNPVPWLASFGGSGIDTVTYLTASTDDVLYFTGTYQAAIDFGGGALAEIGGGDVFVTSLSPGGHHRWSRGLGSEGLDTTGGIAVDSNHGVFVLGTFDGTLALETGTLTSEGGSDVAVIAFDRSGKLLWARAFGGPGDAGAGSIALSAGRIYVNGSFSQTLGFGAATLTSAGQTDMFLAALDLGGEPLWAVSFGGADEDSGTAVAVDGSGRAYVSGSTRSNLEVGGKPLVSAEQQDGFVAAFDADGNTRWAVLVGGPGNDVAKDVAVRDGEGVAVIGEAASSPRIAGELLPAVDEDGFVVLLDVDGQLVWGRAFGATGLDMGSRVAFARDGGVLITGTVFDGVAPGPPLDGATLGAQNPFMLTFDAGGTAAWSYVLPAFEYGSTGGIAGAENGDVFIAGAFARTLTSPLGELDANGQDDIFVARMAPP